jgi:hypothetical protein
VGSIRGDNASGDKASGGGTTTSSGGLHHLDDMLLHLMMYDHPPLMQAALRAIMLQHSQVLTAIDW